MGRAKFGFCFGCALGFLMVFLMLFALAFGVYCCFFPETWDRTVTRIESIWQKTKEGGDQVVSGGWNKVKESGDHLVESVPRGENKKEAPNVPEPEVKK